jgi:decaprenyl-phosphate phosphoribosyltransferase
VIEAVERPGERGRLRAAFVALRPRQWTKNLLVFAGIVFAARIDVWDKWGEALVAFVAYCAASSASYLVNDVRDAEHDRLHPVKRLRPIARGELSERAALSIALVLAALAVALSAVLGIWSFVLLLAFLVLQSAYSAGLKHVVLVDVVAIAMLFVIRAAAGAVAVHVSISPWLLACTALLALFLALTKRGAEIALVEANEASGRPVLAGYPERLVARLVAGTATATVIAYAAYTLAGQNTRWMAITIPFVALGIGRYVWLARAGHGEEPEEVLLRDAPLLAAIVAWIATCAAILLATS